MNVILGIREKLRAFYANYDVYIRPVLKFALAMLLFMMINSRMGYLAVLDNLFVILILAVICAILPVNGIVVFGILLIVLHCFGLGVEVGVFALILYLLLVLLYFRFVPKDALVMLLTPAACTFRVPGIMPIGCGLLRGPLSALSLACGFVSWQFIQVVRDVIVPLKNSTTSSLLDVLQAMPKALLSKELILDLITCIVVMLVVSVIRKLVSTWSWEIAIAVGAVLYLVLMIAGGRILGIDVEAGLLLFGTVISVLIAFVMKFFFYNADYAGAEYLQFEDDHYFYHVKVIPKLRSRRSREEGDEDDEEADIPEIDLEDDSRFQETGIESVTDGENAVTGDTITVGGLAGAEKEDDSLRVRLEKTLMDMGPKQ